MSENNFWNRVEHGCDKIGVSKATCSVWKHRGRVSKVKQIDLFKALQGTEYEISLDEVQQYHPKQNEEQTGLPA